MEGNNRPAGEASEPSAEPVPEPTPELPAGTSLPWDGCRRWWAAQSHQRRVGIRTVGIVLIVLVVSPLSMRLGELALNRGWFGYSNWAMELTSIVFYLPAIFGGLIDMHLAVWFHCRFPQRPPVRHIVLAVILIAIVTQFIDSVGAYWLTNTTSPMRANLANLLWNLMAVPVYLVALRAFGPLIQFVWVDPDADERTFTPSRRWSTLGLMMATGIAAAYFAMMRFTTDQWSDPNGVSITMPPIWLMLITTVTHILSTLFVISMAALAMIHSSWRRWLWTAGLAIGVGLAVSGANSTAFNAWMETNGQIQFATTDWFQLSIQHILMWLGHLWFFGRWKQAGYRLIGWNRITGLSLASRSSG